MRWSAPADRRVVAAVLACFRDTPSRVHKKLSALDQQAWSRSYYWLDASGMALYLLRSLELSGVEDALPAAVLARLRQNSVDNKARSADLFEEFLSINQAFLTAGVSFCNLKGFTLSPDSCPDPSLRCQLDLDFLIDGSQIDLCREILSQRGYTLCGETKNVREFKAGPSTLTDIRDHYKARPQRSLELHFACSADSERTPSRDERLDRLATRTWDGLSLPVLSSADQFIGQALHLFGHLCGPCTRLAWFLEYRRHRLLRANDTTFWEQVREQSQAHPHAATAIGLATVLSNRLFGAGNVPQVDSWTVDSLSPTVRLWADLFGEQAVLADFPGTKLYLLLKEQLASEADVWKQEKRKGLLPLRPAPRISVPAPGDNFAKRMGAHLNQLRFILFRLRFHSTQGLAYAFAQRRWKRHLALLQQSPHFIPKEAPLTQGGNS
jgi:hypothetical protein